MSPAAQSHIAGERKRSRWDKARLSLVLPIGAIVAVAIVCVVVAVLTSAKRADEVSLNREQQLLAAGHRRQRHARAARARQRRRHAAGDELHSQHLRSAVGGPARRQMAAILLQPRRRGDRRRQRPDQIHAVPRAGRRRRGRPWRADLPRPSICCAAGSSAMPEHAVAVIAEQDPASPAAARR